MIFIAARFKVRPEYSNDWQERVRDFTEATRREP
jgi:quinol monooxygenase YgiN